MKTLSPLLLCLCAVLMASPQFALADDGSSATQAPPADGPGGDGGQNPGQAERMQRWKMAMSQIGLTDDQRQQIRQIRQTVTDPAQRRRQVLAVLTPEQKQKLFQLLMQYRKNGGAGEPATAGGNGFAPANGGGGPSPAPAGGGNSGSGSSSAGVAGDGSDLAPGAN